jgi:multiple sugar transport system substrate-binding protein
MIFLSRILVVVLIFLLAGSCKTDAGKDTQLLFWCSNNPQEIQFATAQTKSWNTIHTSETVHQQPIPEGQSSEEVILAAVVGKTTPDIYANMWQGNVEMFARAGVLIPLDTLQGFVPFIRERCDSAVIKEITSVDGHIYQVPWKVNPIMCIYNKNLFLQNDITELPETYSAYLIAAEKFKQNSKMRGLTKNWFGYTEVKPIWYQRFFNFLPLYYAASDGAPLIVNNKAAFNNKYAIQVFAFLQSLYENGYYSREILSASADPFVSQQIATKLVGPWEIPHLLGIPDRNFEFGYYEPPVPDNHSGPVFTYANPKNMVIFNTCKTPQIAWEFIKTMITKQGDEHLLEVTGQLPRRKNLATDPFFKDFFTKNPMLVPFARQVPFIKEVDNCEVIVEVLDIISQEYESCVVYGKKTPAKAIGDAETAVNVLLAASSNKKY